MEEAIVPAIYDPSRIDKQIMIESEEAIAMARQIIVKEGIFCRNEQRGRIACSHTDSRTNRIGKYCSDLPRRAEKYLSTKMFEDLENF